jgi:hypothetical protein
MSRVWSLPWFQGSFATMAVWSGGSSSPSAVVQAGPQHRAPIGADVVNAASSSSSSSSGAAAAGGAPSGARRERHAAVGLYKLSSS